MMSSNRSRSLDNLGFFINIYTMSFEFFFLVKHIYTHIFFDNITQIKSLPLRTFRKLERDGVTEPRLIDSEPFECLLSYIADANKTYNISKFFNKTVNYF